MKAYAYIAQDGTIDISTVSGTALAAKVNAVVTGSYGHMVPVQGHTEEQIHQMFIDVTGGLGTIERVTVKPYQ